MPSSFASQLTRASCKLHLGGSLIAGHSKAEAVPESRSADTYAITKTSIIIVASWEPAAGGGIINPNNLLL